MSMNETVTMKKGFSKGRIVDLHPKINSKLSLDSLTMKAGKLKLKLSQRSSYLTDGLSISSTNYCPLDNTDLENLQSHESVETPYCKTFQRRQSLPISQSIIMQQSLDTVNIIGEINEHVPKKNARCKTAPVIYGPCILQKKSYRHALLKRSLNTYSSASFVVGTIIGSGIFLSPSSVFLASGSAGMSLLTWFLCGLIAMLAALCYIELGTEIPRSGAEFNYLRHGFGRVPAFLFSWTSVLIIRPSAIAVISLTIGQYAAKVLPDDGQLSEKESKYIALICIGKHNLLFWLNEISK